MPIYEYLCRDCGKKVEMLVRPGESVLHCPYCGGSSLEKLLSTPYVMKGASSEPSGWSTCCGRDTPCDAPPCSTDGVCRRG